MENTEKSWISEKLKTWKIGESSIFVTKEKKVSKKIITFENIKK